MAHKKPSISMIRRTLSQGKGTFTDPYRITHYKFDWKSARKEYKKVKHTWLNPKIASHKKYYDKLTKYEKQ